MTRSLLGRDLGRDLGAWGLFDDFFGDFDSEPLWRLLARGTTRAPGRGPFLNAWVGPEDVVVTTELPGVEPGDIHISVEGDTLKLSGERKALELREGEKFHRQERTSGQFSRALELPFRVDANKVEARYDRGVLRISLPRAPEDRPRRIEVKSA
jgi:HSP20 family protein